MHPLLEVINKYVYLKSFLILISFFGVSKLFFFVTRKFFYSWVKKTKTKVDDKIIHRTGKPISLVLLLIGLKLSLIPLNIGQNVISVINNVLLTFLVLLASYIAYVVFDVIINNWGMKWAKKTKSTLDDNLISLLQKTSKIIVYSLGLIYALDIWGIDIIPVLASMGIAGIAIAFALKNSLSSIIGGITLILDKSVEVGDLVELEDSNKGTVLDIGLRSTKIRTFSNELVIIPNSKLAESIIRNYTQPDVTSRVVIPFGVGYGSDIDKVKKIVLKGLSKIENVLEEPSPFVRFSKMGDYSLDFKLYFWVNDYSNASSAEEKATILVYEALEKNDIEIPNPQMDVNLKK